MWTRLKKAATCTIEKGVGCEVERIGAECNWFRIVSSLALTVVNSGFDLLVISGTFGHLNFSS
jgi:hypothetical protein